MGGGTWTTSSFCSYSASRGRSVDSVGTVTTSYRSAQDMYTTRGLSDRMDPKQFEVRECRDTEEHPHTLPIILALDVTGSMGPAAMEVAKSLNGIVTDIAKKSKDAEFCVMAIGDTYCDRGPIQMSQFESDIRIAKAFDDIWFEGGGGSNAWESYTAAWYMAAYRTSLDAWKRGGKGILITLGDEPINPSLDKEEMRHFVSSRNFPTAFLSDIDTKELYNVVKQKYDVYHIYVDHIGLNDSASANRAIESFKEVLPEDHVFSCRVEGLPKVVSGIVLGNYAPVMETVESSSVKVDENGMIDW